MLNDDAIRHLVFLISHARLRDGRHVNQRRPSQLLCLVIPKLGVVFEKKGSYDAGFSCSAFDTKVVAAEFVFIKHGQLGHTHPFT